MTSKLVISSVPSVIASELRSLNDLLQKILLQILSHVGPEDLCLNITKVCKKWNILAKHILSKTLSYECDRSSDIVCIKEVRCVALLGFDV